MFSQLSLSWRASRANYGGGYEYFSGVAKFEGNSIFEKRAKTGIVWGCAKMPLEWGFSLAF